MGKGKRDFYVICFFVLIFTISLNCAFGDPVEIKVDFAKRAGRVPDIFQSSVWISSFHSDENRYVVEKFLNENRPAVIQLTMHYSLRYSSSFDDFKDRLREHFLSETAKIITDKVKRYNTTLVVGFETATMPGWLSSRRGDKSPAFVTENWEVEPASPPADYKLWGEIVGFTMKFLRDEIGIQNLGLFVGHEPDAFWLGKESSFFKFYEYAAKAAKKVDKRIKVGGIGTQSVRSKKSGCEQFNGVSKRLCSDEGGWADTEGEPMLKNFIEYVGKNRVPLDFVNWHSFNVLPLDIAKNAKTIRSWINEAGLDEDKVILFPADWTYWSWYVDGYPADYLDTTESAAYVIPALYNMWKAGIKWHGHDFDIANPYDEDETRISRNNSTFVGDWRITTRHGVVKPIYNVFKALSIAMGNGKNNSIMIDVESPLDDNITPICVAGKNRMALLINSFVPENEKVLKQYIFGKIKNQMFIVEKEIEQIENCVMENMEGHKTSNAISKCKIKILNKLDDPVKIEALNYLTQIYGYLHNSAFSIDDLIEASKLLKYEENKKTAKYIKTVLTNLKSKRELKLKFYNFPFKGDFELTSYTIDTNHANACGANKQTEPTKTETSCGVGGKIDKAVWALEGKSQKEGKKVALNYFKSLGYSDNIVNRVKGVIKESPENLGKRLNTLLKNQMVKNPKMAKQLKTDLHKSFKVYKNSYKQNFYFGAERSVDDINKLSEVSLEGSKKTRELKINNKQFFMDLDIEPNSIHLFVLSMKS